MGIQIRVTVPRKMLGRHQQAVFPVTFQRLQRIRCHRFRRISKTAGTDDGIIGIVIDIRHRCIIEIHPERMELPGCDPRCDAGVFGIPRSRQRHFSRNISRVFRQPGDATSLLINADKGWISRFPPHQRLDLAAQLSDLLAILYIMSE